MSLIRELKHFGNSLSLLVVEDEIALNAELVSVLSTFFKSVDFAFDGKEGLEKFAKNRPDIVLTDISMPKMDGIKMSQEIKNLYRGQHIVVLSAHGDTKYMIELIDIGIDQFILKPFDKNTLMYKLLKVAENIIYKKEFDKFYKDKQLQRIATIESIVDTQPLHESIVPLDDIKPVEKVTYNLSHNREDADEFMESLKNDELMWMAFKDDITELMELSAEFGEDVDNLALNGRLSEGLRTSLVHIVRRYAKIFSQLEQMAKMSDTLELLAEFLEDLDVNILDDEQNRKLKLLEYINNDITRFLQTVFVYKDSVDIYYLEDSLESSILQLKSEMFGLEVEEDEAEFF
ncbi:response regulator transcription factor [Arcobacter sp. FWKO B]|uniref:response regulator transcription factor n=1 Tax=Arcobacter sp. FWKO B TaxID=2593672 RepID=UPI0018A56732|nr:response regulator [Arcobacter sp. FWKO B]QOG11202.1 response regulator [Arcobacter sp. FWKO B]